MTGGGLNSQVSRYTHNDSAFSEYNSRLQSSNLQTFTTAASKFTEWLGSDRAYYPNARVPIVSIIESAHANICRVQGDQSVPFTLDRALPGLDPWYQPYLMLLRQVGRHLNHFEPELRARLRSLVENAGMKIVQVPTLTENTAAKSRSSSFTERGDNCPTRTDVKENTLLADASSQAPGPSNQAQQPETVLLATKPEPQKKGRRKLNSAIFEVDTAAAMRTKSQAGNRVVEPNNSPVPEVNVKHEVTGTVHRPVLLPENPPDVAPMEHELNAGNSVEEEPHAQSKDRDPLSEATVASPAVASSDRAPAEDTLLSEKAGDAERPHEDSPVTLPQGTEPDDDPNIPDNDGKPENLDALIAKPSPEEIDPNNINDEPPCPLEQQPETTSEPIAAEPPTTPIPHLEEVEMEVETPTPPQDVTGIMEDVRKEIASPPLRNTVAHDITRRKSDDSMSGERSGSPAEPPVKRVRVELEANKTPSRSTSPAVTPAAVASGPPNPVSSLNCGLPVTHGIQRSSSDMILDSEDEATPPPRPDADKRVDEEVYDNSPPPAEQQHLSDPHTETLPAELVEKPLADTPMPPIQELSIASPETKPNPFATSRLFIHPPGSLPLLVRSTVITDVGCLSLHSPTVHNTRNGVSTPLQAPQQEPPVQKTYVLSAAEIRTLVASRGSDEDSGPNKLVFYLDWDLTKGIIKWRNFKAGQGPLEGSVCLSLACYPVDSVAALMSTATESQPFDALIRQARIKSSWPSGSGFHSTLKDGSGKLYAIPPFSTTDDNFIDISDSAIPGVNTYTIEDCGQSLSNWLFAVYAHTPTIAYFNAIRSRVDKEQKWVDSLTSFTRYSLPAVSWTTSQAQRPD